MKKGIFQRELYFDMKMVDFIQINHIIIGTKE